MPRRHAARLEAPEGERAEGRLEVLADGGRAAYETGVVESVAGLLGVARGLAPKAASWLPVSAEASARPSASWSAYASGKAERCTAWAATVISIASYPSTRISAS